MLASVVLGDCRKRLEKRRSYWLRRDRPPETVHTATGSRASESPLAIRMLRRFGRALVGKNVHMGRRPPVVVRRRRTARARDGREVVRSRVLLRRRRSRRWSELVAQLRSRVLADRAAPEAHLHRPRSRRRRASWHRRKGPSEKLYARAAVALDDRHVGACGPRVVRAFEAPQTAPLGRSSPGTWGIASGTTSACGPTFSPYNSATPP